MIQDQDKVRWPGSGSSIIGKTPFGFFDADPRFQLDGPKIADWSARRLGYPIQDVELIDLNMYACFEEAILEYGAQVNQFNIRNNLGLLQGQPTTINITQQNIQGTGLPYSINLAQSYGTENGYGGQVDWKKGEIEVTAGTQNYDLQAMWGDTVESGSRIEIKRVFHNPPPAFARIYDPFSMTGMSYSNIMNEMGFAGFSPATQFLMTPIFEDLLRGQAIEFNDMVRKSAWSFEVINNKLRLFPVPSRNMTVYFEYVVTKDRDAAIFFPSGSNTTTSSSSMYYSGSNGSTVIGDYSNVPYEVIPYMNINEPGKQWIRKYFLALCKELLGAIRQKYQTIPIPGSEVTLDGGELRQEAAADKTELITQLRENLEATSRSSIMEKQAAQAQQLNETLMKSPMFIYLG